MKHHDILKNCVYFLLMFTLVLIVVSELYDRDILTINKIQSVSTKKAWLRAFRYIVLINGVIGVTYVMLCALLNSNYYNARQVLKYVDQSDYAKTVDACRHLMKNKGSATQKQFESMVDSGVVDQRKYEIVNLCKTTAKNQLNIKI